MTSIKRALTHLKVNFYLTAESMTPFQTDRSRLGQRQLNVWLRSLTTLELPRRPIFYQNNDTATSKKDPIYAS